MTAAWPSVPLGSVIKQRKEFVLIDDTETYKRCRVQLHAQGIVLRDQVVGAEVKTKKQQVCQAGELLVAEIDAKVGGYGIVPPELDSAIVSSHYFLFQVDERQLERGFLAYYIRTPAFFDQVSAQGSTNYAAIRPADVLSYSIPLPPLAEQRRIVAQIDALATKVQEAHTLRRGAGVAAVSILDAAMGDIWGCSSAWTRRPLGQLAVAVSGQVDPRVEPYSSLPHINGEVIESGTCRLLPGYRTAREDGVASGKYHFGAGAILYSKIRPYLRKAAQVPFEGVCSADIYAFERISEELERRFFAYALIAPDFTDYANAISGRTRMPKLNRTQLYAFEMGFPPRSEQCRIVGYLDGLQAKVGALKALQAQTAAELDALMPSILDAAFSSRLTAGEAITVSAPAAAGEPAPAPSRKPTPFKDDAAIVCLLIDALARHDRPTDEFFSQKHAFVLKERAGVAVNSAFVRQAAGPWSQQLKRRAIYAGEKMNWLRWAKGRLVPGPSFQKGLAHARALLGDKAGAVAAVVEDLARFGRNGLERWTTVLKVVRDMETAGKPVTLAAIQREIDAWTGKRLKEAFTEESVDQTVRKMVRQGWIHVPDARQ